ncbi:hypothetical protein RJ639_043910 [Escallonia herrerae]|uniref:Nuclease associated modular domain-containing protein n=1 Tax=Escallonia herrerae TaxID=1293975 RepID=A0AA88WDZ2_9ASTE|nr:hypothetical protein RJ639_043910 [Escallonia herrerae]
MSVIAVIPLNALYGISKEYNTATAQPAFLGHSYTYRSQILYHGTFIFNNEKRLAKFFRLPNTGTIFTTGQNGMRPVGLMIKAVATLEPKFSVRSNDGNKSYRNLQLDIDSGTHPSVEHQSLDDDSEEVDEREKLRRMRISKANKGNTPWNKGRKHSPETLQRIRERTRLAMQNPKVKMKLANLGHAQSEETRVKIGVGVRVGWERRRQKLMLQETCHFEWQNFIAEASRRGFGGEEELQWDSYKILDGRLEQEWVESVEQRRRTPRPKGSKRAPKSLEQRRKISEAIAAKWADPTYRDRVYSGLTKYHGTPVGLGIKPRRKPVGDRQPKKTSPTKKKSTDMDNSAETKRPRLKRSSLPPYKDPLASSKLEMIKTIRAQRAAAENNKSEAITRAKLLIAEAEKAAKALEAAATRSPLAQASLIETRKLIAEAIQSIESIETGLADSPEDGRRHPITSNGLVNHVEAGEEIQDLNPADRIVINGAGAFASTQDDITDFGFSKLSLDELLNGREEISTTSSGEHGNGLVNGKETLPTLQLDHAIAHSTFTKQQCQLQPNGSKGQKTVSPNRAKSQSMEEETPLNSVPVTKRWVRGKLVEVTEGD